jgi:ABC-type phosphate transport system substrate-binding protein
MTTRAAVLAVVLLSVLSGCASAPSPPARSDNGIGPKITVDGSTQIRANSYRQ